MRRYALSILALLISDSPSLRTPLPAIRKSRLMIPGIPASYPVLHLNAFSKLRRSCIRVSRGGKSNRMKTRRWLRGTGGIFIMRMAKKGNAISLARVLIRSEWNRDYWTGLFAHGFGLCGTTHAQWNAEMDALLGHCRSRTAGCFGA